MSAEMKNRLKEAGRNFPDDMNVLQTIAYDHPTLAPDGLENINVVFLARFLSTLVQDNAYPTLTLETAHRICTLLRGETMQPVSTPEIEQVGEIPEVVMTFDSGNPPLLEINANVHGTLYRIIYSEDRGVEALRQLGRWAADPTEKFSWYNAAVLSQALRQNQANP